MVLFKKRRLLNEIIFIGFLIYLFVLATISIRLTNITFLLPNKISIFEIMKTYFFATSLLLIIEYFVAFDLPNNYLLSRVFGFFVMCTITLIIFNLYSKTWVFNSLIAINIIYISSIIIGCIASYYIQRFELRKSSLIGFINYGLILFIFIALSFISPSGYIFE